MATSTTTPKIPCNNRGCKHCGSIVARIGSGNERHPASLVCVKCGQFWRWMGKLEYAITIGSAAPQPRQLSLFEVQGGES